MGPGELQIKSKTWYKVVLQLWLSDQRWGSKIGTKVLLGYLKFKNFHWKNVFWIFRIFFGHIPKLRVFLKSSLILVYPRPLEWFWDIFLGREICSQSWGIIFRKSTKFPIFESQENVWPIFYMKQLESDKTKDMAELALRSRFS